VPPSPSVSAPTDPPGATASPGGATESDVREAIRQYNSAASAADQLKFLPFDFEKYQALLEGVAVLAGAGTSDWERLPPDGPPLPCDTITRMPDATAALMLRYYYDAIQTTADFGADVLLDIRKATDLFEASDASGASSSTWIVLDGTIYRLIL
jgi:hypothetical protein